MCILISSILLTFNDVNLKINSPASKILTVFDYIFRLIFIVEMIIKWVANGLKRYFSDWWCILDFIIVSVGIFLSNLKMFLVLKFLDFNS
jgi:voltage-gated sodium channel type V alpha